MYGAESVLLLPLFSRPGILGDRPKTAETLSAGLSPSFAGNRMILITANGTPYIPRRAGYGDGTGCGPSPPNLGSYPRTQARVPQAGSEAGTCSGVWSRDRSATHAVPARLRGSGPRIPVPTRRLRPRWVQDSVQLLLQRSHERLQLLDHFQHAGTRLHIFQLFTFQPRLSPFSLGEVENGVAYGQIGWSGSAPRPKGAALRRPGYRRREPSRAIASWAMKASLCWPTRARPKFPTRPELNCPFAWHWLTATKTLQPSWPSVPQRAPPPIVMMASANLPHSQPFSWLELRSSSVRLLRYKASVALPTRIGPDNSPVFAEHSVKWAVNFWSSTSQRNHSASKIATTPPRLLWTPENRDCSR